MRNFLVFCLLLSLHFVTPAKGAQISIFFSSDTICPYTDPGLYYTTSLSVEGETYYWEFHWAFENGNPPTASGNYPSTQWTQEGTFEIVCYALKIPTNVFNPTPIDSVGVRKNITIDGRCCSNLPGLTSWNSGQTISQVYIVPNGLQLSPGTYTLDGGTLYMEGLAIPAAGPGGTVDDESTVAVEQGAELEIINGGAIKAWCEEMWYGIAMEEDATIMMDNGEIHDSYRGVFFDWSTSPSTSPVFNFYINRSLFVNNYRGIYCSANYPDNYIRSSEFSTKENKMLAPFNKNALNNAGEKFKGEYACLFDTNFFIEGDEFSDNVFRNHLLGVVYQPGLGAARFEAFESEFFDHSYSALHILSSEDVLIQGCDIEIPLEPDTGWQYQSLKAAYSPLGGLPLNDVFGIYNFFTAFSFDVLATKITTSSTDPNDINNAALGRMGIYARTSAFFNMNNECRIFNCNTGIFTSTPDNLIEDAWFLNNNISISVFGGTAIDPNSLQLSCSRFDDPFPHTDTRFGLFLQAGTFIEDIGGLTTNNPPGDPSGNAWPVDTALSPGYPNAFAGSTSTVADWEPAPNFFSIFDANAANAADPPSFIYYRWRNEYVGDEPNVLSGNTSVWPDLLVIADLFLADPGPGPSATCHNPLMIPFPAKKPSGVRIQNVEVDSRVYPNPGSEMFYLQKMEEGIQEIEVYDLEAERVDVTLQDLGDKYLFYLEGFESGIYLIKITGADDVYFERIIVR